MINIEAEKSLLGSILIESKSIFKVFDTLETKDFYKLEHQKIYAYMLGNINQIDILSIGDKFDCKPYLVELMTSVVTASHIELYAKLIKECSIKRQIEKVSQINNELIKEERDVESILVEAQNNLLNISLGKRQDDSSKTIIKELEEVQKEYSEKLKEGKKYIGIETGIEKIDNVIDGLRPSHIWTIGAFTSTGKTQFSLNIVHKVLEQRIPTAIISLEMSRVDTLARLMGIRHNVSSMAILKGYHDKEMADKIKESKLFFSQAPLEIHTTYFNLEKIKYLIRSDVNTKGVKVVVLDYIQNIMSEKAKKEYELLTKSAVDLQALARELKITIIIVSQISNEAQKGQGAGAGFKGTGAIEAVSDIAIRLKRNKDTENPEDEFVPVEIQIAKNRHGFTGRVEDYCMYLKSGKFEKKLYLPKL